MRLNEFTEDVRESLIKLHLELEWGESEVSHLSQGKYGTVYSVINAHSRPRAAKLPHFKTFENEIELKRHFEKAFYELEKTNGLRLNPYFNTFYDVRYLNGWPCFISNLWDCTLKDLICDSKIWNLEDKLQVAVLLVRGLLTAQEDGFSAHQDLKPENIFIKKQRKAETSDVEIWTGDKGLKFIVKIGDLGMADAFSSFGLNSASRPYQAPEQYSSNPIDEKSARKMDVFALGVLFHEMFTDGFHPIGEVTSEVWPSPVDGSKKWTREKIWKKWAFEEEKDLNLPKTLSQSVKDLVVQMLSPNVETRPDLSAIFNSISDELNQKNSDRLINITFQMQQMESNMRNPQLSELGSDWPYLDEIMMEARRRFSKI